MAGSYANSGEYIKHHLTNLTFGQKADGSWGIAHGADEIAEMGFWAINLDSMIFSTRHPTRADGINAISQRPVTIR